MLGVLLGTLFPLLFLTVPIAVCLALCTAACFFVFYPGTPVDLMLAQSMVASLDSFALMAIPYFMLVGTLMESTGLAEKLINLAKYITGDSHGGLAGAGIVACMFFAAISGSGPATAAAIGALMIPALLEQGYSREYSGAIIAGSSIIGPVIPPSILMIMYGVAVGVSVSTMFLAGFIPGIFMGLALILYNYVYSRKKGFRGVKRSELGGTFIKVFLDAIPAMFMPIIVLGGIYTGIFTPTESSVIGVVYTLLVGKFIYRKLDWSNYKKAVIDAAITTGTIMLLQGGANTFGKLLTMGRIPQQIIDIMNAVTQNPVIIMLIVNFIFLIAGMFIDGNSIVILFAPLFTPLIVAAGYNIIHFGIIMVINCSIGMLTPPLGGNLFIGQRIAGCSFEGILKEEIPILIVHIVVLVLLILIPDLTLFIPRLFGMLR
jgi:C4-dicarboxylate transporter DctM subunit